jgi:hypothetical protein
LCTTARIILQLMDELRHTLDPESNPPPLPKWENDQRPPTGSGAKPLSEMSHEELRRVYPRE